MPNWWIYNLWEFLYSIQGTIQVEHPWTIPKLWHHDHHLMQDFLNANTPTKDLSTLNNCQIYLQVTTLAKIIWPHQNQTPWQSYDPTNKTPTLHQASKSNFKWPAQTNPGKRAWNLWTCTIQTIYTKPGLPSQLMHPLGLWYCHASNGHGLTPTTQHPEKCLCISLINYPKHSTPARQLSCTCTITKLNLPNNPQYHHTPLQLNPKRKVFILLT